MSNNAQVIEKRGLEMTTKKINNENTSIGNVRAPGLATKFLLCGSLLAGLIGASRAEAADFGVRVVDEFGQPLAGASVCLGTRAQMDQFGSYVTSPDGHVVLNEAPRVPLNVVVSKQDYQGVRFVEPIRNFNIVTEVTLLLDGEGPVCHSPELAQQEEEKRHLSIANLFASKKGPVYTIRSEIEGEPSHYRISTRKDFKDAKWLPYKKRIKFWGQTDGNLFYQVKRFTGGKKGWLEARSHVASIAVN